MTGAGNRDEQWMAESLMQEGHHELKRILWKCRRGTRELDLTLGEFVRSHYSGLPEQARAEFQSLLEYDDSLLIEWLCYRQQPDVPEVRDIVSRICSADVRCVGAVTDA